MKIIFLDIDGVVINRESCHAGFGLVDKNCVDILNRITDETGALLVISSCWRIGHNVPELREMCSKWGITGKVLDRTPHDWELERGDEIAAWLAEREKHRGDVESFTIIDDDRDMGKLLPKLVHTSFDTGLVAEDADKAIAMLNGGSYVHGMHAS